MLRTSKNRKGGRRRGGRNARKGASQSRVRRLLGAAPLVIAGGTIAYVARRLRGSGDDGEEPTASRRVRDAMTAAPSSIGPDAPVAEAARRMRDEDVGSLPVVSDGRLVGMITDRDIVLRVVADGRSADEARVSDAASRQPTTVTPDQGLDEALRLMAARQVRRLPVVEGERLVGIVAQADLARTAESRAVGDAVEGISEPSGVFSA